MILFIVISVSVLIVAALAGLTVWFIRNDGKGGHTGGGHSFRPLEGPPRPLVLPYMEFGSYARAPELHHDLPGPVLSADENAPSGRANARTGEPDSLDLLIEASQILAPHVYAGLSKAGSEDTATSASTLAPWIRAALTCPIEYLPEMIKADQMSLALAVRAT